MSSSSREPRSKRRSGPGTASQVDHRRRQVDPAHGQPTPGQEVSDMPGTATDIGHLAVVLAGHELGEQADHGPVNAVGREHLQDIVGVLPGHLVVAVAGDLQVRVHRSSQQGIRHHRHRSPNHHRARPADCSAVHDGPDPDGALAPSTGRRPGPCWVISASPRATARRAAARAGSIRSRHCSPPTALATSLGHTVLPAPRSASSRVSAWSRFASTACWSRPCLAAGKRRCSI